MYLLNGNLNKNKFYITFSIYFVLFTLLILNIYIINSLVIGVIALILYSLFSLFFIINIIQLKTSYSFFISSVFSFLFLFCWLVIGSALICLIYTLNNLSITLLFFSLFIFIIFIYYFFNIKVNVNFNFLYQKIKDIVLIREKKNILILFIIYLFIYQYLVYCVFSHQTGNPLKSPWEVLPDNFFVLFFIIAVVLISIIFFAKNNIIIYSSIILFFLLFTNIAEIIYKLGFGYDPIVHLRYISKLVTAEIVPKKILYLGFYSSLASIIKVIQLPFEKVELFVRFFISSVSSVLIPMLSGFFYKKKYYYYRFILISLLILSVISHFITTIPLNFALIFYLFQILLFFILDTNKDKRNILLFFTLSCALFFIHPMVGVSSLIINIIYFFYNYILFSKKIKLRWLITLTLLLIIITSIIYPLSFLLNSLLSSNVKVQLSNDFSIINIANDYYSRLMFKFNNYDFPYNIIYLYKNNYYSLLLIISFLAFIISPLKRKKYLFFIVSFIIIQLNYIFSQYLLDFVNLINYEKNSYNNRIYLYSFYLLLPIIFNFFINLGILIKKNINCFITKLILILIIAALITCNLYICYPKYDKYEISSGFGTSEIGLKSVQYINKNANNNENYIVLADQMIAVLAQKEYGWIKTCNDKFYYSIPVGEELYQTYLNFIRYQDINEIKKIAKYCHVKTVYVILPDYWNEFSKFNKNVSTLTDDYVMIHSDDRKSLISKFTIK